MQGACRCWEIPDRGLDRAEVVVDLLVVFAGAVARVLTVVAGGGRARDPSTHVHHALLSTIINHKYLTTYASVSSLVL